MPARRGRTLPGTHPRPLRGSVPSGAVSALHPRARGQQPAVRRRDPPGTANRRPGDAQGGLFQRRRLLHQPGGRVDAGRKVRRPPRRGRQAVHGQGHARSVRRAADAQPAEVLPAVVAGVAGGHLFAGAERWRAGRRRRRPRREVHEHGEHVRERPSIPRPIGRIFRSSPARSTAACRWSISTTRPPASGRGR